MALCPGATLFLSLVVAFGCGVQQPYLSESQSLTPNQDSTHCNQVFDECIEKKSSYYTEGGKIFHRGVRLHIRGINWFGLDVSDTKLHGLWTGRTLESFVDQVADLGFNAFRIPLAPETLNPLTKGSDGYKTARDQLEHLLFYTAKKGMYVLLDLHKCSKDNSHADKPGPGLGVCATYPVQTWLEDLREMARISSHHKNVLGIDIFNEPYGFSWSQWRPLAEQAGVEILKINPQTLVFVEGVGGVGYQGRWSPFWGENLSGADRDPVKLPPSQLVYSPHVYGPSVAPQDYFNETAFPYNMPAIWDEHFGSLRGKAPLVVGEFGGRYDGKDQTWKNAFVAYLKVREIKDFFYWSLNPNSGDTGGLLEDDWKTVNQKKYAAIKPLLIE